MTEYIFKPISEGNKNEARSSSPAAMGSSYGKSEHHIHKDQETDACLVVAAVMNVPAAEAILIPLPGGGLQSGVPYTFRISASVTDIAVMLQAVVRNRLELEETATAPAGSSIDLPFTIPSRDSQVILVLDPAMIGTDPQFFGDVTLTIL